MAAAFARDAQVHACLPPFGPVRGDAPAARAVAGDEVRQSCRRVRSISAGNSLSRGFSETSACAARASPAVVSRRPFQRTLTRRDSPWQPHACSRAEALRVSASSSVPPLRRCDTGRHAGKSAQNSFSITPGIYRIPCGIATAATRHGGYFSGVCREAISAPTPTSAA